MQNAQENVRKICYWILHKSVTLFAFINWSQHTLWRIVWIFRLIACHLPHSNLFSPDSKVFLDFKLDISSNRLRQMVVASVFQKVLFGYSYLSTNLAPITNLIPAGFSYPTFFVKHRHFLYLMRCSSIFRKKRKTPGNISNNMCDIFTFSIV